MVSPVTFVSSSPVSPRYPCRRLSPSAPTIQTIGLPPLPSDVVTIGAPSPSKDAHHAVPISAFGSELIFSTVRRAFSTPFGQPLPSPWKATSVLSPRLKVAGAVRIGPSESFERPKRRLFH